MKQDTTTSPSPTPSTDAVQPAQAQGREDLKAWEASQPANIYLSDAHFKRLVPLYVTGEAVEKLEADLERFGAQVVSAVDPLVRENNLHQNLPRLERYSGIGERVEKIAHHPTYHEAGRYIYGSGVMSAYAEHPNAVGVLSRFYLSSYNGEAGHNCPLACTAGVIRVLQELAPDALREKYLPGFLNRDYDKHLEGAQFLTEVQGGSDVGQNGTRAERQPDGSYRIWGEKWFCSNIDADVFLMSARPDGAQDGTRGLGLFFVPRELDDGTVNNFTIRRLKDKLGTRSMASGECDFRGARAYHMGASEDGFKNMMTLVINTSRLFNAAGCMGLARRAYITARTYAAHRHAFGQPIINYPLVQETLANLKAEVDACTSGTLHLAWLSDRNERGQAGKDEQQFLRMALNLNKVRTAKSGRWACVEGIEILGGNGAIESFSPLPRLLRDAIVFENWEGTHNTLQMQIMRDMQKYGVHEGFFSYLENRLRDCRASDQTQVETVRDIIGKSKKSLASLATLPPGAATLAMRPQMDRLAWIFYAVTRLWERGQQENAAAVDDASVQQFIAHRLLGEVDYSDSAVLSRLRTLLQDI
ncbi:acyl-CoA dehydrogenase family protein [Bradymonas sediminis]|uniref:Acyl-CoA dehydrogenase n=1 Tax=Bradymonas sediminis TaxID=1548548 RepID=A0A2Z4FHL5_9DELT|nr:acyl-CoA dehydrogenase family protein [Bradymonas sediminis]AWV88487.1 acyl-CoA dehydrogenase [Bradymonas sediminis]TDP77618.1 alkylation response protein AidB-like acyl-CoA dehydrogenase [Bradymonas sediminis]